MLRAEVSDGGAEEPTGQVQQFLRCITGITVVERVDVFRQKVDRFGTSIEALTEQQTGRNEHFGVLDHRSGVRRISEQLVHDLDELDDAKRSHRSVL